MITLNGHLMAQTTHSAALAGSIYAVAAADRQFAAQLLGQHHLWVHADVILSADGHRGVDLDTVRAVAEAGTAPLDVHLITEKLDSALLEEVCREKITRVTVPWEVLNSMSAAGLAAETVHSAGAQLWVALAPETQATAVQDVLGVVDGVLVMLLEPGSTGIADPLLCSKVAALAPALPVGVDGGVGESNVDECLRAGATYVVSGRALLCSSAPVLSAHRPEEKVTRCPRR